MRSLLVILSLSFLVSFQAAVACCDHDAHSEELLIETSAPIHKNVVEHSHNHDHNGPCDCACHQTQQHPKSTFPAPRLELEPAPVVVVSDEDKRPDYSVIPSSAPPVAENLSLPPPTAAELCSQHCRFLI